MEPEIPQKYTDQQKSLTWKEYGWSTIHYVMGTAAVVLAFLSGSKAVASRSAMTLRAAWRLHQV